MSATPTPTVSAPTEEYPPTILGGVASWLSKYHFLAFMLLVFTLTLIMYVVVAAWACRDRNRRIRSQESKIDDERRFTQHIMAQSSQAASPP